MAHHRAAQQDDPVLVVRERRRQQLLAYLVSDQDVVFLRGPVDPSAITHVFSLHDQDTRQRPDPEVPLRLLIDKALNQRLRPVAARGTSPPSGGARLSLALTNGKHSGPPPGGGRAKTD
jgi:hypothetical protein